jgi:hypothetical protein
MHMRTRRISVTRSDEKAFADIPCRRQDRRCMLARLSLELERAKSAETTVRAREGVNDRVARGEWVTGWEGRAASDKSVPHGLCGRTKVIVLLDHHAQPCGYRGWMRGNGACECAALPREISCIFTVIRTM